MRKIEDLEKNCILIQFEKGEIISVPGNIYGDFGVYSSKIGKDVYQINEQIYVIAEMVELYNNQIIGQIHDAVPVTEVALDEMTIEYKE